MENILILGGAGFIGFNIARKINRNKYNVKIFDRQKNFEKLINTENLECIAGDFSNIKDLKEALKKINIVIHLISLTNPSTSNVNINYDVEANIIGTINLLQLANEEGISRIIFASSGGAIYGEPKILPIPEIHSNFPICSYGITKLAIEKYLFLFNHMHGIDYKILRISNPYGPGQKISKGIGAIGIFIDKVIKNEEITIWGNGETGRDYIYINDVVEAFLKIIETDNREKIYNIGSGKLTSLNKILDIIQNITGRIIKINYTLPRPFDVKSNYLDISLAKNKLTWEPNIVIEQGINLTYKWIKQNGEEN